MARPPDVVVFPPSTLLSPRRMLTTQAVGLRPDIAGHALSHAPCVGTAAAKIPLVPLSSLSVYGASREGQPGTRSRLHLQIFAEDFIICLKGGKEAEIEEEKKANSEQKGSGEGDDDDGVSRKLPAWMSSCVWVSLAICMFCFKISHGV